VTVALTDGSFGGASVYTSFRAILDDWTESVAIGIDIPIGLPVGATRQADVLARRLLGRRRPSVFLTPPRSVLLADTYREARRISTHEFGRGVSAQAYALRKKILEVEGSLAGDQLIREVHPEMAFRAMAGEPLEHPKRTWNGQMVRRSLLADHGIALPDTLDVAGSVAVDDVLDAAAVAWSARRIAMGVAESVPDPPELIDGVGAAIWW
jgi:predicted RNase H-like nuclease